MGEFRTARTQLSATRGSRSVRFLVGAAAVAIASLVGPGSAPVAAHEGIESSTPQNRSTIDDPISSAEIDFGEGISDSVSMFLTYDPGDGSIIDIGGDTTVTGDTTARLDFPEITEEGTYFVRYLAPIPADGHVVAGSISFTWGAATTFVSPNPDIRESTPNALEVLTEPITSAEIDFELEIEDEVRLQLVYDEGNGIDFDELDSLTTKTGPSSARVDFDELDRKGTYIIAYDAIAVANGDEVVGATSFVYGQPSGTASSSFPWLAFLPIALLVLGIGAYFTYRRMLVVVDEDSDEESELTPA